MRALSKRRGACVFVFAITPSPNWIARTDQVLLMDTAAPETGFTAAFPPATGWSVRLAHFEW